MKCQWTKHVNELFYCEFKTEEREVTSEERKANIWTRQ
jgi:hypothetical protein